MEIKPKVAIIEQFCIYKLPAFHFISINYHNGWKCCNFAAQYCGENCVIRWIYKKTFEYWLNTLHLFPKRHHLRTLSTAINLVFFPIMFFLLRTFFFAVCCRVVYWIFHTLCWKNVLFIFYPLFSTVFKTHRTRRREFGEGIVKEFANKLYRLVSWINSVWHTGTISRSLFSFTISINYLGT